MVTRSIMTRAMGDTTVPSTGTEVHHPTAASSSSGMAAQSPWDPYFDPQAFLE
ncbi:hypothetical protein A2U01_0116401, partial [Trifolium medium]|nr:hypothetical protein [Trifolium medium]